VNVAFLYLDALQGGGYPRDARWLAGSLADAGVGVNVIARPGSHRDGLGKALTVDVAGYRRVASNADVVHVWGVFTSDQFRLTRWLRPRSRYVISPLAHLMTSHLRRRWWKKFPYLAAMQPMLATSRHVAHYFSEEERTARASRYLRAKTSFDASLGVFPLPATVEADDALWGGGSAEYLLFLGRNDVYQKGIDILLSAYSRAVSRGLELPLVIAGQAANDSEKIIRRLIARLGLANHVDVVGRVEEERKWELLLNARCLVFLSRWDGPPRPVREAMAGGTPVIVSPGTNLGDVVRSVGGGLCVGPSLDVIADGFIKCQNDAVISLWRTRAKAFREILNWSRVAEQ
jgi:glycosyltransferase involved in cell wall biosynthesis